MCRGVMSYPCDLEERVHRRLARGDLEGASLASSQLGKELRSEAGVAADVLVPLLHSCLWRIRQTLGKLFGDVPGLPAREELARALADGNETRIVDQYEHAVRSMIEGIQDADARAASPAYRARSFVDENFTRPISTATVARAVACSEAHLCVLFRQAYRTTVGDYIRRCRVERAKALLSATRLPVKAVAHESGFGTYRTFLRNFRGLTGMSPRRYRGLAERGGQAPASEGDDAAPFTPRFPGLA